jgi:hypothetical protein
MSPGLAALLPELVLLGALLAAVVLLGLLVGWSVVLWLDWAWQRRTADRQRRLLAQLSALEMACGTEFPQVGATVQYVRALVVGEAPVDVVAWRAQLRGRWPGEPPQARRE